MSEDEQESPRSGMSPGCLGFIALLVAAGAWGALSSSGDEPDEYGAQVACEDRVKTGLKSPGSASFSGIVRDEIGQGRWEISGAVDADNSFGASIRGRFTCEAYSTDGETWTTSNVSIN